MSVSLEPPSISNFKIELYLRDNFSYSLRIAIYEKKFLKVLINYFHILVSIILFLKLFFPKVLKTCDSYVRRTKMKKSLVFIRKQYIILQINKIQEISRCLKPPFIFKATLFQLSYINKFLIKNSIISIQDYVEFMQKRHFTCPHLK